MGDSLPGLQARLMSQALRKLTGAIAKSMNLALSTRALGVAKLSLFDPPAGLLRAD